MEVVGLFAFVEFVESIEFVVVMVVELIVVELNNVFVDQLVELFAVSFASFVDSHFDSFVMELDDASFVGFVDYFEDEEARLQRQMESNRKYKKSILAILLPIIYCVLDSCGTFVDTLIADNYTAKLEMMNVSGDVELLCGDILNVAYEFTWFFMAIIFAIYVYAIKKEKIDFKFDGIKTLGGLCETIGQVFYMMVVVSDYKVGLVIISAYCALSLVWGRIFLKEKLSLKHYIAIAIAFIGIVILGIYDV